MRQQLDDAPTVSTTGWNRPGWLLVLAPVALIAGALGVWLLLLVSTGIARLMGG